MSGTASGDGEALAGWFAGIFRAPRCFMKNTVVTMALIISTIVTAKTSFFVCIKRQVGYSPCAIIAAPKAPTHFCEFVLTILTRERAVLERISRFMVSRAVLI